jgi:chitodextrinase
VSLAWTGPTAPGCLTYDIERAPSATGPFTVVGQSTGLSFTNTGLTPSTNYFYRVLGRVGSGTLGPTNVVSATTAPGCTLVPPPVPGNLAAQTVGSTSVTLSWVVTAAPGCSFTYEIFRAPGATGGAFALVATVPGNSYTDSGLTANTTYRYQARTRDADGALSGFSNTVTVTTTGPTTTTPPPGGCTATHRIVNSWGGAYQGEMLVRNNGTTTINGWTVVATMPSGVTITQMWGGTYSPASGAVTIRPTYTATVPAGQTVTFGYIANAPGSTGATPNPLACSVP